MSSSSGYKGRYWKKPEDRGRGGGAPKHPDRSANDSVRRGGGAERETPFLSEVTAQTMEKYIAAVHQYTLSSKTHDALAPWIRGRIPEVMLEFPQIPPTKIQGTTGRSSGEAQHTPRRNRVDEESHSNGSSIPTDH